MSHLIRTVIPKDIEVDETPDPEDPDVAPQLKEITMEEALHQVLTEEEIVDDTWFLSQNKKFYIVEFSVIESIKVDHLLDRLAYFNIGKTVDSYIMVIEPTTFVQKRKKAPKYGPMSYTAIQHFVGTLKSRLCVAQVYNEINKSGSFDMNYLCFLVCAAVVANIALVTNSAGVVFASMLLSPLMDPIMCILFGLTLRNRAMIIKGIRNTTVSLIICILIGIVFGYPAHLISIFEGVQPYPTPEMFQRGKVSTFIASMLVAAFSGVSVSFATLNKRLSALIGNAISLSLLPPAVNCGQLILLSMIASHAHSVENVEVTQDNYTVNQIICRVDWVQNYSFIYVDNMCKISYEFFYLGIASFFLVAMNILLILVTGYTVNKIKNLVPLSFNNELTRRFYQKDVVEVREQYNNCLHKFDANDLASYAYNEYLRLNKLDPNDNSYKELDSQDTQELATNFQNIMKSLEKDPYLNTITSSTSHGNRSFLMNTNDKNWLKNFQYMFKGSVESGLIGSELQPPKSKFEVVPSQVDLHVMDDTESENM